MPATARMISDTYNTPITNVESTVFFRAPQDDLTVEEQKHVTYMLGKLTRRPEGHGLHVHPLYNDPNNIPMADGTTDPNMYAFTTAI